MKICKDYNSFFLSNNKYEIFVGCFILVIALTDLIGINSMLYSKIIALFCSLFIAIYKKSDCKCLLFIFNSIATIMFIILGYNAFKIWCIISFIIIAFIMNFNEYKTENIITARHTIVISVLLGIIYLGVLMYNINIPYCYDNDEKYTIEAAVGFIKTGKFVLWDFNANSAYQSYSRASIYTLLVSGIFKIWGVSVVGARVLSCLFGFAFAIIVLYICIKLYKNYIYSLAASGLILYNPNIITIFRTARMHSLGLLLTLLLFIVSFLLFNKPYCFRKHNVFFDIWNKYIMLNPIMLIAWLTLVLLIINVQVEAIACLIGIYAYIVIMFILEKTPLLKCVIRISLIFVLTFIFIYILYKVGFVPANNLLWNIDKQTIFQFSPIWSYFTELIKYGNGCILYLLLMCIQFMYTIKTKTNLSVNMFCIVIPLCTLIYFVFFTSHYYQYRYVGYLWILISLSLCCGLYRILCVAKHKVFGNFIIALLLFFQLLFQINDFKLIYLAPDTADFKLAYEALYKLTGKDMFSFFPSWYQSYYMQQFGDIDLVKQSFFDERKVSNKETNFKELLEYIHKSNKLSGYISMEYKKMYMWKTTRGICEAYLNKYSGKGIDESNVDIYYYNFITAMPARNTESGLSVADGAITINVVNDALEIIVCPIDENINKDAILISLAIESDNTTITENIQLLYKYSYDNQYYYVEYNTDSIDNIRISNYLIY